MHKGPQMGQLQGLSSFRANWISSRSLAIAGGRDALPLEPDFNITSPTSKVRVFSEAFRYHETKVAYFIPQFLHNYKLKPYVL